MSIQYTLGLDVGTNSIGWAILRLNDKGIPSKVEKMGSRIFTDGREAKTKTTLAAHRRQKRQERRRRARLHQRKKLVINQLIAMSLFPSDIKERQKLKELDVLPLRAKAADEKISSYELGRVFYHLNLKRGFKSNRKGDSSEDSKNKISERIQKLKDQLTNNNFKTVGQYLNHRYKTLGLSTKATIENDFHLLRQLIEEEFDLIVNTQRVFHTGISDKQWTELRGKVFHQRPLKPVETGPCSLYPDKFRTFKYMPSFEEYRFLTELFNLSYQDANFKTHLLTPEQVLMAFNEFKNSKEISYTKLKKFLKIPNVDFSIEKSKAKEKIKISVANALFSDKSLFGKDWNSMPALQRDKIAEAFFSDLSEDDLKTRFEEIKVPEPIVQALLNKKVPAISESTCPYSSAALQKLVELTIQEKRHPALVTQDLLNNEQRDAALSERLGYYGASVADSTQPIPSHIQKSGSNIDADEKAFGRIANPTVHAALRQIGKVVNDIVSNYGKPEYIHIEFARDLKKSKEEKLRDQKKIKENEQRNQKAKEFIEKYRQKPSAFNFERVKLWFELEAMRNQVCIYSGKTISARMVLSDEVQVDHILPFSRTLDDSMSNKVLVLASENIKKKNKTPYEAFGTDKEKWAGIQERVQQFPYGKQWRFAENAIQKFEEKNAFLGRHLNDTRYISKIAKKYLGTLIDPNKIVASKGQLTSLLRGKLGLNQFIQDSEGVKDREDHRHHAIDALTVALTSRGYLKKISDATSKRTDPNRIDVPEPWPGFIKDTRKKFDEIVVSHKKDHGANGPLMEETCFGLIKELNSYEKKNNFKLITTKKIADIKKSEVIRDPSLRKIAEGKGIDKLPSNIKKLRTYEVSKEPHDEIGTIESGLARVKHGADGVKYYQKGDINYLAIWYLPKEVGLRQEAYKKRKTNYIFVPVKTFDLNSKGHNELKPHPAAKLVTKIYKGDTVALRKEKEVKYYTLKSIRAANRTLYFLEINRATERIGEKPFIPSYSKLHEYEFRKIHISPAGIITDHGPLLK